jgi:zinc transporter
MDSPPPSPPSAPYGGDASGLICGYRFQPGQAALPLATVLEAAPWLDREGPGFLWLHFNLSHAGAAGWLRQHGQLSDDFFDDLAEGSCSTRIERDGDTLFGVINDVTFDFGFDASDVATLWLSVGQRRVISARRHPLRSVDRLRTAVKRGEPLDSSVALLNHLLRDQADELQRIVRRATDRIDDIEDAMLAGQHHRHAGELARLRRLTVRLQRLLAPEPGALMRTLAHPPRWVPADDLQLLHGAHEEFALVLRDVAAMQDRVKLMQDEAAARLAEENSRSLFTLTAVTVLALPINLLAGLFGMNVGGIPLSDNPHGFWLMVATIGALTAVLAWLALRRLRPPRD